MTPRPRESGMTQLQRLKDGKYLDVGLSPTHDLDTPLRYPGGKSALSGFVSRLISSAGLFGGTYVEPYAGGAGVALRLLRAGAVSRIVINDLDPLVFNFWDHAVHDTDFMLRRLSSVGVTMDEFRRQRDIIRSKTSSPSSRAFAYLFLNRTTRSGIADGGPIGGLSQSGHYRLDCRFNKSTLSSKLAFLGENAGHIKVTCEDGVDTVNEWAGRPNTFVFADPPYVRKGGSLYLNALDEAGHISLATALKAHSSSLWLLTYDEAPLVYSLYGDMRGGRYFLRYSAHTHVRATELMVFSDGLCGISEARQSQEKEDKNGKKNK